MFLVICVIFQVEKYMVGEIYLFDYQESEGIEIVYAHRQICIIIVLS